jgi:hypothetical protein
MSELQMRPHTFVLTNEPVIKLLKEITKKIEENRFEDLEKNYTFNSPAGDGWGVDSVCIDFSRVMGEGYEGEPVDFGDVLRMLNDKQQLKRDRIKELEKEIEETRAL